VWLDGPEGGDSFESPREGIGRDAKICRLMYIYAMRERLMQAPSLGYN